MIVTEEFYTQVYMGEAVDTAAFPRFEKRAEELVNIITKGKLKDFDTFHESIKESIKTCKDNTTDDYTDNDLNTGINITFTGSGLDCGLCGNCDGIDLVGDRVEELFHKITDYFSCLLCCLCVLIFIIINNMRIVKNIKENSGRNSGVKPPLRASA